MAHSVCSVPPLHHGKGKALDASRKLALRAAFSAVSFCNGVAKTVEKRKDIDRLIVPLTKRSVGKRHYMAHTVCSVPPLHHGKGKPLTRAENLHCRAAFSAVSFCNGVAKTVEIRKTFHSLIVTTTKR